MNEIAEINQNAWELAASAMVLRNGKLEAYSTSQIRKIMSSAGSKDFHQEILRVVQNYKPAPPQNINANQAQKQIREKAQKNTEFGQYLARVIVNRDFNYVQKLLRYTLWDIKIIENSIKNKDKLNQILNCECVGDKWKIVSMLEPLLQANAKPVKHDERQGFNKSFRR
jgi:hypothetical protein